MYRPDEMVQILEQAKRYAISHRLAYTELTTLVTDPNSQTVQLFENNYYKVSDSFFDISRLKKVFFMVDGNETQVGLQNALFSDLGTVQVYVYPYNAEVPLIFSATAQEEEISEGVYVICADDNYISKITFETIHPIPQEYIPPLDRLILNGADGNQYALTITDGAISIAPVTT